jgi:DNA-directed RNA polymerase subunit RPC12/RpoP
MNSPASGFGEGQASSRQVNKGGENIEYCINCGSEVSDDMVFCIECGYRLVAEEEALPAAKRKRVPRRIQNILARDEFVEKDFHVKGCRLYATGRRLLELKDSTVRDFAYAHISSFAYTSKHYLWLIGVGIALSILGAALYDLLEFEPFLWIFLVIGFVLVIFGALLREEFVEVTVVGVPDPIRYEGPRQTLQSLVQLIGEKQAAEPAARPEETEGIDFIEEIRKLAELRDQGILTQEEFEEQKRKLLEARTQR